MPFGLKIPQIPGIGDHNEKKDVSLDDILPTAPQKTDLIVLVTLCTYYMQGALNTIFDKQNAADMQDLKGSSLGYFTGWRTAVLKRMIEALELKADAVEAAIRNQPAQSKSLGSSHDLHPNVSLPASIQKLDEKARAVALGAVLFMLLSLENYQAHSRVLATYLCQCLQLPLDVLASVEVTAAATLLEAADKSGSIDAEEARKKKADEGAMSRKWKIGLATIGGTVLLAITGGLAAPIILGLAGGILGGIGLGGLATFLGATIANPVTIAALFGALGGRMTSRAMDAYAKEVQDFKFMPISDIKSDPTSDKDSKVPTHKLRVAVGVSGWVTEEKDINMPWRILSTTTLEPFALRYEKDALISLGTTLDDVLKSTGFGFVRGKAIGFLLPTLGAAMAPVGMLNAGKFLDNPFTIAIERSDKAGKVLARALIDRAQGERPVTLIGFSMGARVVFSCLEELAAFGAFGLIENAVLIGAPVPSSDSSWRRMRAVVAGRLINVYSEKDMILAYLYRARNLQFGVAGLDAVTSVPNLENKDVSEYINGHNQYRLAIGRILEELKFADLDLDQIEQEKVELDREKIYEDEFREQAKREGRLEGVVDEKGQMVMAEDRSSSDQEKGTGQQAEHDSSISNKLGSTHLE